MPSHKAFLRLQAPIKDLRHYELYLEKTFLVPGYSYEAWDQWRARTNIDKTKSRIHGRSESPTTHHPAWVSHLAIYAPCTCISIETIKHLKYQCVISVDRHLFLTYFSTQKTAKKFQQQWPFILSTKVESHLRCDSTLGYSALPSPTPPTTPPLQLTRVQQRLQYPCTLNISSSFCTRITTRFVSSLSSSSLVLSCSALALVSVYALAHTFLLCYYYMRAVVWALKRILRFAGRNQWHIQVLACAWCSQKD